MEEKGQSDAKRNSLQHGGNGVKLTLRPQA